MSKMDALRIPDYLAHMLEAIARISHYTEDIAEYQFLTNSLVQDAVIRNIEILGEAARNMTRYHSDFVAIHASIPWNDIYLMRNQISHGYFTVDLAIIWNTIQKDLPWLEQQIQAIHHQLLVNKP